MLEELQRAVIKALACLALHLIAFLILLLCTFIHNANRIIRKEQKVAIRDVINDKVLNTIPRAFFFKKL